MSGREHTRALRPYLGSLQRDDPVLTLYAPWPWGATVTVTALPLAGYEHVKWEIATAWFGPPLPGAPPSFGIPVHGQDVLLVDDELLARAVAQRARNSLARGQLPDLWVLSGQVRKPAGS